MTAIVIKLKYNLQAIVSVRAESTRKPPDQAVRGSMPPPPPPERSSLTHSSCSRSQRAQCHGR